MSRGAYLHLASPSTPALEAFQDDKRMKDNMENGSAMLRKAHESGIGPTGFLWHEHTGFTRGAMGGEHRYPDEVIRYQEREAFTESLRVRRDPCSYCGTRGDIGCKHQRVA